MNRSKSGAAIVDAAEAAKKLNTLVQLDIDATFAYTQAIDEIDVPAIRDQLLKFREDHNRHIQELSGAVREMGQKPPEYSRDFKGFLIEGMTRLQSAMGTNAALKAMETNEKLTNRRYHDAISWDLPAAAMAIIQQNYRDEQRHLQYIQETLAARK